MEIREGLSYHIKDEFYERVNDRFLMGNKENEGYRPHHFCIRDDKNSKILWMIPLSTRVEKYQRIYENKMSRHGRCDTIILGEFGGELNAFLIQNAFPTIKKYLHHIHTINGINITVHRELEKELRVKLQQVLAMHRRGIPLIFPDINKIYKKMEEEISADG